MWPNLIFSSLFFCCNSIHNSFSWPVFSFFFFFLPVNCEVKQKAVQCVWYNKWIGELNEPLVLAAGAGESKSCKFFSLPKSLCPNSWPACSHCWCNSRYKFNIYLVHHSKCTWECTPMTPGLHVASLASVSYVIPINASLNYRLLGLLPGTFHFGTRRKKEREKEAQGKVWHMHTYK